MPFPSLDTTYYRGEGGMKAMIESIASGASALAAQGQAAVAAKTTAPSQNAAAQSKAVETQASAEQAAAVTVELSDQAQAKALKIEGLSISEIATKLKLDEKTVSSYVNAGD
jgi:DNA-binding NarL/FixJ family response regulator